MKWILVTVAAAGLTGLGFNFLGKPADKNEIAKPAAGTVAPVAVLELFTSEGCSSCPPADKLLPKLAALDPHVIALSFHVDYWDRLGWKDPFSSSKFSERQREYNTHFGLDGSYTPQLIVNGSFEFVGSNRIAGENAVRKALLQQPTLEIAIESVITTNNKITVTTTTTGEFDGTELQAALLQKNAETKILAGENSGATLSHTNVVRDFVKQTTATKNEFQLQLPKSVSINDCQVVVYARQKKDFKITGAALYNPE
jgi:hypothetical protein